MKRLNSLIVSISLILLLLQSSYVSARLIRRGYNNLSNFYFCNIESDLNFYLYLSDINNFNVYEGEYLDNTFSENYKIYDVVSSYEDEVSLKAAGLFFSKVQAVEILDSEFFKEKIDPILRELQDIPEERAKKALDVLKRYLIDKILEDSDVQAVCEEMQDGMFTKEGLKDMPFDAIYLLYYITHPPVVGSSQDAEIFHINQPLFADRSLEVDPAKKRAFLRIFHKITSEMRNGKLSDSLKEHDFYQDFIERVKMGGLKIDENGNLETDESGKTFDTPGKHFSIVLQTKELASENLERIRAIPKGTIDELIDSEIKPKLDNLESEIKDRLSGLLQEDFRGKTVEEKKKQIADTIKRLYELRGNIEKNNTRLNLADEQKTELSKKINDLTIILAEIYVSESVRNIEETIVFEIKPLTDNLPTEIKSRLDQLWDDSFKNLKLKDKLAIVSGIIRQLQRYKQEIPESDKDQKDQISDLVRKLNIIHSTYYITVAKETVLSEGSILGRPERMIKYWHAIISAISTGQAKDEHFIGKTSEEINKLLKAKKLKIAYLARISSAGETTLEFELTDRRWEDMFRGYHGDDCTKDAHFYDTLAHMVDPSILHFKIRENGRIVGYMVCVVGQDRENGKTVLIVDSIQLGENHYLADGVWSGSKNELSKAREKFADQFLEKLKDYAERFGFKQIVFANQKELNEDGEEIDKPTYISNRTDLANKILKALKKRMSDQERDSSIWRLETGGLTGELHLKYRKLTEHNLSPIPLLEYEYLRDEKGNLTGEVRYREPAEERSLLNQHLSYYRFPDNYQHFLQGFNAPY